MNTEDNKIIQVQKPSDAQPIIVFKPSLVIEQASEAAKELKKVIDQKKNPVMINNEQYLEFEDWQTLASFYNLAVKTGEAESIEVQGVKGARATASVIDMRTGIIVGGAMAYCLRDERNWINKPYFQLASMAQTRAGSKALRNILARVVVLAGYKPTPAEEIQDITPRKTNEQKIKEFDEDKVIPQGNMPSGINKCPECHATVGRTGKIYHNPKCSLK